MDDTLRAKLTALYKQNEKLSEVRSAYLLKESERKHFEAKLIHAQLGKSHAENLVRAQASIDWLNFSQELAKLENAFEFEKLKYDILDKAFLAEHLSLKLDTRTISRLGTIT